MGTPVCHSRGEPSGVCPCLPCEVQESSSSDHCLATRPSLTEPLTDQHQHREWQRGAGVRSEENLEVLVPEIHLRAISLVAQCPNSANVTVWLVFQNG